MDIEAALQEYSQLSGRNRGPEIIKPATGGTPGEETQPASATPTTSRDDNHDSRAEPNTTTQAIGSDILTSQQLPYLTVLHDLATEFGATLIDMKKDVILLHIKERWNEEVHGELSEHLRDVMATPLRPPEAQKGRGRRKSGSKIAAEKGLTLKPKNASKRV